MNSRMFYKFETIEILKLFKSLEKLWLENTELRETVKKMEAKLDHFMSVMGKVVEKEHCLNPEKNHSPAGAPDLNTAICEDPIYQKNGSGDADNIIKLSSKI